MKSKKIVVIITIIFMFLILLYDTNCMAYVSTGAYDPGNLDITSNARVFKLGGTIVTVLKTVGTVIAVIGIIILGIKYMIGSVEQRADYKKTMIPYLVGCIMIFAIGQIVSIIYNLVAQV